MLSSFIHLGAYVTRDQPAYQEQHQRYLEHLQTHLGPTLPEFSEDEEKWLNIALAWTDSSPCAINYFGNHIMMLPLYNLGKMEYDPVRQLYINDIFAGTRLWNHFREHKNSLFNFILGGLSQKSVNNIDILDAVEQLWDFGLPPRVHWAIDRRNDPENFPPNPNCPNKLHPDYTLGIALQPVEDYQWQSDPWRLLHLYGTHDGRVAPGGDFWNAYWFGREEGFLQEDSSICLAFIEPT
jgi:hypothetical protein